MNSENWYENEEAFFKNAFSASDKTISEWQKRGFSLGEATEWSTWGVMPVKASQYISDGMKVIPDARFKYSEIGIRQAFEWESAGFDYDSAIEWLECGVKCETALVLQGKGVSADDFSDFLLFDIPLNKALKWLDAGFSGLAAIIWTDWKVSCERAIQYVEEGIHEPPDEQFREAGLSLADALKWFKADIDFDTASDWIEWKVPTDRAIELVLKDEWPPGEEFKKSGLSFEQVMEWKSDFSEDEVEFSETQIKTYWKPWHDAGFTVKSAKTLQLELCKHLKNEMDDGLLARKRPYNLGSFEEENRDTHFKILLNECVDSIINLSLAGMKVTVENLVLWRGMTSNQILACIDGGIDASTGYRLGDSVLSAESVEMLSLLKKNGFNSLPAVFKRIGLANADLQNLIKLKVNLDEFATVCSALNIEGKELMKWAKVFKYLSTKIEKVGHYQRVFIADWIDSELNPKEAWAWYSEGFTAGLAKKWIKSGVTEPSIAARRKSAGLEPR